MNALVHRHQYSENHQALKNQELEEGALSIHLYFPEDLKSSLRAIEVKRCSRSEPQNHRIVKLENSFDNIESNS